MFQTFICILLLFKWVVASQDDLKNLIKSDGYKAETYQIITEDGYELTVFRIPQGSKNTSKTKTPILLFPSFLASAADWVVMGPKRALAYNLAENGFDVWLANTRGTTMSRKHRLLDPDKPEDAKAFWDFSFHEMGVYDVPALVDFILNKTQKSHLQLLGFSQGTTIIMIFLSERPEYTDKVSLFTGIAPAAYVKGMCTPFVIILQNNWYFIKDILDRNGIYEFVPHTRLLSLLAKIFCNDSSPFQIVCGKVIQFIAGLGSDFLDKSKLPLIVQYTPAGASTKQATHFLQISTSDIFAQFDYGEKENIKRYNQVNPPKYHLENITVPVALYSGGKDCLATPPNVKRLERELPNVVYHLKVKNYVHLDFVYAKNGYEVVFKKLIETAAKYK